MRRGLDCVVLAGVVVVVAIVLSGLVLWSSERISGVSIVQQLCQGSIDLLLTFCLHKIHNKIYSILF